MSVVRSQVLAWLAWSNEHAKDLEIVVVVRQNVLGAQVVDLPASNRRQSRLDDHPSASPAASRALALRRPPPPRPREPRPAPAARRVQADDDPTQAAYDRPPLLGRAVQGVGGLEAGSGHRVP